MIERTETLAYEIAMEAVEVGQMFACVPVLLNGEPSVYTATGSMPEPKDDLDVFTHAYMCIKKARDEAERCGAHPVQSTHV